jgi:hypothetical protein
MSPHRSTTRPAALSLRRQALWAWLCLALLASLCGQAQAQSVSYCSNCRHPALARGVNMFDWFMGPNIYQEGHQNNYVSPAQLKALKDRGFTHLRIPVYARFIADVSRPNAPLYGARIGALDTALALTMSQGLAVVLVLNPEDDMYRLATTPEARTAYASLWRQLAARYQGYPSRQIYFEILNEPHFNAFLPDAEARASWYAAKEALVSAIRSVDTLHFLIVPAYDWDTVASAIAFDPRLTDPRTLYTAHFYEFIAFTHQGLQDFGDPVVRQLHGLPYPAQGSECQAALSALAEDVRDQMGWYCEAGFGPAMIDQQMRSFALWADRHRIPVYLGEFGAAPAHAPAGAPERWIKDVRTAAEKYRLPWSYWSYKGAMGLVSESGTGLKPSVMQALGR